MTMEQVIEERRQGQFEIPQNMIIENPEHILEILKDMFVIRCELMASSQSFMYIAYSKHFSCVDLGCAPRKYKPFVREDIPNFVEVKWDYA